MTNSVYGKFAQAHSRFMQAACISFAAIILILLVLVTGYLLVIGASSISWAFFSETPKADVHNPGGMLNGIVGTLILVGLASVVGIPIGMLCGVYLSEYGSNSKLATPTRFVSDVLAGVPSIVVGILGYELLVVPLGHHNGWAGSIALAFIMIPIVARTTEEMLRLVPKSYREASIALGATKAVTILRVVIPSATGSLVTGIMLAIARVAGETAPLIFTAAGSRFLETNPNLPFPSLTKQIFDYASSPYPEQKRLAWAGILVLISLIFVLNLTIRYFANRTRRTLA
jgi:phosphate transport system permease protein